MTLERIVAVGGGTSSGKSTVGNVARDLGYDVFETSDLLRRDLERNYGIKNADRETCVQHVISLTQQYGPRVMGVLAANEARESDTPLVMVCGIRHPAQLVELQKQFGKLYDSIFVHADKEVRYARALLREKIDMLTAAQESAEKSSRIRQLIENEEKQTPAMDLLGTQRISRRSIDNTNITKDALITVAYNMLQGSITPRTTPDTTGQNPQSRHPQSA